MLGRVHVKSQTVKQTDKILKMFYYFFVSILVRVCLFPNIFRPFLCLSGQPPTRLASAVILGGILPDLVL